MGRRIAAPTEHAAAREQYAQLKGPHAERTSAGHATPPRHVASQPDDLTVLNPGRVEELLRELDMVAMADAVGVLRSGPAEPSRTA